MSRRLAWLCALMLVSVALIVYQPAFKIGHEGSWWFMEYVARLSLSDYMRQYFDPALSTRGYRPMEGMMVLAEYSIFRVNADGYHLSHILMHAATSLFLWGIVWKLSHRARLAFLSALIFVTLPAIHLAVFRAPSVIDPFAAIFYLATIWFWILHRASARGVHYALSLVAFVLAVLTKELSVFLPGILFLIDYIFVKKPIQIRTMVRDYAPLAVVMIPYLLLELEVQRHGEFSSQFGFKIGWHMLPNVAPYAAVMTFPWYLDNFNAPAEPLLYVWLAVVSALLGAVAMSRKNVAVPFLSLFALVNISPLLPFPREWYQARYLYLPLLSTAVLMAAVFERVWDWLGSKYWRLVVAAFALLLLVNGQLISLKAAEWAEYTRVLRVPFRDIARQHPTFPEDTYLYFIYSPTTSVWDLEGLFFVRYGIDIEVDGTDTGRPTEFRSHNAAFVYYFDSTGRPIEIPVDKNVSSRSSPALPVGFGSAITLDGYDLPTNRASRGKALVIILNWSAADSVEQDYTVFVHLLDKHGKIVAAYDSQPRRGEAPTSTWRRGQRFVDAIVLTTDSNATAGDDYRLEIGLYDGATMQRLPVVAADGAVLGDKVVIEPFEIVP